MELKSKYFHTIMPYVNASREKQLQAILHKAECILKSGYIMPYKDIKKEYGDISRHPLGNINGEDKVSIALHSSNPQEEDQRYLRKTRYKKIESATDMFTLQEPSIVLNEAIKEKYNLLMRGIYLERQVKGPISLEYMDAFTLLPTPEVEEYFNRPADKVWHNNSILYFDLEFLKSLKALIKKYGYNVPIVDYYTGNEFSEEGSSRILVPPTLINPNEK